MMARKTGLYGGYLAGAAFAAVAALIMSSPAAAVETPPSEPVAPQGERALRTILSLDENGDVTVRLSGVSLTFVSLPTDDALEQQRIRRMQHQEPPTVAGLVLKLNIPF